MTTAPIASDAAGASATTRRAGVPPRSLWLPALVLVVGLVVAVVVASQTSTDQAEARSILRTAGFGSLLGALIVAFGLSLVRRRSAAVQVAAVALGAVAVTVFGVALTAQAMFISSHDLGVLAVVLVMSAAVAATAALVIGQWIRASADDLGVFARQALDPDVDAAVPGGLATAEFTFLAEQLDTAQRDLAAARAREAELEQARSELVAWMSHDLRSPIAAIRALSEALVDGVVDEPADVDAYQRSIIVETERLARLVDDLFELSRIHAGAVGEQPMSALDDVVGEVAERAAVRARAEGRVLHADIASLRAPVAERDMRRILDNLIDNAIRFSPAGGAIHLGVATSGGDAVVTVADSCGGVSDEVKSRVFDLGYRADDARNRNDGGGGLGLAIARGLAEARGASLSIDDHEHGCVFSLRLPGATS